MIINLQWERNLQKMFDAVLKDKFDHWNRKYGHKNVFPVWAEMMGNQKPRFYFRKAGWKLEMTIKEALEALEEYCREIEEKIPRGEEEK